MLKVNFGTAESKLKKHIGTNHSLGAEIQSDLSEKRNLLSAVPQFTFSIFPTISITQSLIQPEVIGYSLRIVTIGWLCKGRKVKIYVPVA